MLDTTVFNKALDGEIPLTSLAGLRPLVTGIQADQLRATKDSARRTALLTTYEKIDPSQEPAASFAFGIEGAGWDQAHWNDGSGGSGNFEKMLHRIRALDRQSKKKNNLLGQLRDILIAETAPKNGAILFSHDCNLRKVISQFGGQAVDRLPVTK